MVYYISLWMAELMAKKRNLSRDVILQTAVELAEGQGLDQLTIQRLANALGVKPASLYNHIEGFDDVRGHLATLSIRQLHEAFLHAAAGKARDDAVLAIALAYRQFAAEHPELYRAFIRSASLKSAKPDESYVKAGRVVRQVLGAYRFSEEELTHLSRSMRSALHGFISLEAAGFFQGEASNDESFLHMVHGFLDYLNRNEAKAE